MQPTRDADLDRRPARLAALLAAGLALGCDRQPPSDDWFVRPATAGEIVVVDRPTSHVEVLADRDATPIALAVRGATPDRATRWLALRSDAAMLREPRGIVVETPILPNGRLLFPFDSDVQLAPDPSTLARLDTPRDSAGRETLWIAARGDLVLHRTATALTIYRRGATPERHAEATSVEAVGHGFVLLPPFGGSLRVEPPPPPPPESQMQFVPERDTVRFFDASGEPTAELPSQGLQVQGGEHGFLLMGSFPRGVPGVDPGPFDVLLPLYAHRLIVLRGAR